MNETIKKALETGRVLIRRIFPNPNSAKNQVTVQFYQQIDVPSSGTASRLVALAQGIDGAGKNNVTANFSFAAGTVAKMLEIDTEQDQNFFNEGKPVFAEQLFGADVIVNIEVLENTDPNEYNANGEVVRTLETGKVNPRTGEQLMNGEKPIFRHTSLIEGVPTHTFLSHNTTVQKVAEKVALDAAAN